MVPSPIVKHGVLRNAALLLAAALLLGTVANLIPGRQLPWWGQGSQPPQAGMPHVFRLLPADPEGYARELYAALRDLDQAGVDLIAVEAPPATPAWTAVADRLRRAAAGAGRG